MAMIASSNAQDYLTAVKDAQERVTAEFLKMKNEINSLQAENSMLHGKVNELKGTNQKIEDLVTGVVQQVRGYKELVDRDVKDYKERLNMSWQMLLNQIQAFQSPVSGSMAGVPSESASVSLPGSASMTPPASISSNPSAISSAIESRPPVVVPSLLSPSSVVVPPVVASPTIISPAISSSSTIPKGSMEVVSTEGVAPLLRSPTISASPIIPSRPTVVPAIQPPVISSSVSRRGSPMPPIMAPISPQASIYTPAFLRPPEGENIPPEGENILGIAAGSTSPLLSPQRVPSPTEIVRETFEKAFVPVAPEVQTSQSQSGVTGGKSEEQNREKMIGLLRKYISGTINAESRTKSEASINPISKPVEFTEKPVKFTGKPVQFTEKPVEFTAVTSPMEGEEEEETEEESEEGEGDSDEELMV